MRKQIVFLILTFMSICVIGQSADELNEQSKQLIEQEKYEEAIPILKQAAELGNAEAQYNLGNFYRTGTGVEQNKEKEIEWFAKSAEQGYNDAIYRMTKAYGSGDGVEQDLEKGFEFGLKCAENEDHRCMWIVIDCYDSGTGVERNINKMVEWATRLGKLENSENLKEIDFISKARFHLAQIYKYGAVVEKDLFKSYQWFLIFNEFKSGYSNWHQELIIKDIKDLETKLSSKQKRNAQKEAEKLLGRPLKNIKNLYKPES